MKNALQESHGHGWGSAPYGQSDSISRRWAASKPDSWKDDARAARSLFFSSLLQLSGAPELGALKRAQGWPGSRPARLSQPNQPSEGGLRLCQSRNGATKSTIVRRAFPMTSRSHLKSPHENNRRSRVEHVTPETKNWTHAGKRNNSKPALNPSKQVQNWISNPD